MNNKVKLTLTGAVFFFAISVMLSCSKNDKTSPDPGQPDEEQPDESLKLTLEGQWILSSVNFLDETAQWDDEVAFTSESSIGWAPFMYGKIKGFYFRTEDAKDSQEKSFGYKLDFIVGEDLPLDGNKTYWYWNYKENQSSFEMQQIDPSALPYNFSIAEITDIQIKSDGDKVIFNAKLNSRKPGKSPEETIQVPVEITLVRGVPSIETTILLKGSSIEFPDFELTEEENQAKLRDELKEKMGFNSSYETIAYGAASMEAIQSLMNPIETFESLNSELIEVPYSHENWPHEAPFVVIDKNNILYYTRSYLGLKYEKFHIEKEGSLYTIWGEHGDGKVFIQSQEETHEATYRIRIRFDAESRETNVVTEMVQLQPGTIYLDGILKWTQDTNLKTPPVYPENYINPIFSEMELWD